MAGDNANADQTSATVGELLALVRSGRARTRAEVVARTGWGRAVVSQRLAALSAAGLIRPAGELASTGGRPAAVFEFNADAGVVLAAEVGATHVRAATTDLNATVLADVHEEVDAALGPERVLGLLAERFEQLLERCDRRRAAVFGIGIGLAAPVEFAAGRAVNPPIMPGWDRFEVGAWMRARWGVPALVDNEVNMMAIGEHASTWSGERELLCVKASTGIGCGIIADGRIHRGAQGAAGDIGHVRVLGHERAICRCGNTGCLEAVAGGEAIARSLTRQGIPAAGSRDVVRLVREGRPEAVALVRESGRLLGDALAGAVNLLNPSVIVIGGDLAEAEEQLFAGVRETVYQRSLPLATKQLRIVPSELAGRAAVIGAAVTVVDHTLRRRAAELVPVA